MLKNIILALTVLTVNVAFASEEVNTCPKLSGVYNCEDQNAFRAMNFKTKVVNNETTYNLNGNTFVANGETYKKPGSGDKPVLQSATCVGNSLVVKMNLEVVTGLCGTDTEIESVTQWRPADGGIVENDITILKCPGKNPTRIVKQTFCAKR